MFFSESKITVHQLLTLHYHEATMVALWEKYNLPMGDLLWLMEKTKELAYDIDISGLKVLGICGLVLLVVVVMCAANPPGVK